MRKHRPLQEYLNKIYRPFRFLVVILLFAFSWGTGSPAFAATSVFFNEFHYDNTGTDTGEAIEVAGPAGTDLTGWSIVLYNGANGLVYDTDALSGVIPDQGNGFGTLTVSYPSNGIQNGSPDGMALVDASHNVIQFLSYEGSFTAVDGPATEMMSTDIGVSQSGSGAAGNSLQLTGSGAVFEDFAWAAESANTFDAANTGQSFGSAPAPDLVINEIDYDQPGTDTAEFIEIKNNGGSDANLDTVTLELVNGTGGGAAIYQTIDLPNVTLAAGDYFVVCADIATVANCDHDVSPDTNLIQNGGPDAAGLRFNSQLIDAVSYEGNSGAPYTEGSGTGLEDSGAAAGEGISRCPDGADTDQNNVDFVLAPITPGAENDCAPPPPPESCGDAFTPIYAVQGSGLASPLVGNEVSVEGIVVGDFQNNSTVDDGDLNGFYIQDPLGDGDPATSDGVFAFAPGSMDVNAGDRVRVRGVVAEFFNLTEITDVSLVQGCSTGSPVAPTTVSLPVADVNGFERYEGMLVTFPQPLYISEYFNFDRFGEIVLTSERQFQPTAVAEPGSPEAAAIAQANALGRITLDDGRSAQNPDPAVHPNGSTFDLTNLFRGGDTVENVTGVMDFSFSLYRIHPTQGADYTPANPRPEEPEDVGSSLTVASFNVLNYFLTIDTGAFICGPAQNQECRGADTPEEFNRQRAKIISALATINADIFGLIEMENTTGVKPVEPLEDIVNGLNNELGAGTYAYIDTGTIGTDAIRVGVIYKPGTVTPVGDLSILDSTDDPRFVDTLNRPVLAQTFMENATGGVLTVAVNHLKSKGSACGPGDDDPQQGNCNETRKRAAAAMVDWLATDPTGSGDADFLIMGDLNSYDKEDPIDILLAGADDSPGTGDDYTDLILQYQGESAYSYLFDGQLGYLDHALANQNLAAQVTGATIWHINADEPDLIDYDMTFKLPAQDALFEPNAFRSSDHDPVIVGLNLNGSPSCSAAAPSLASLWPANHKFVSISILGVTDPEDDPITITIDGIFQDEAVDAPDSGNTAPDGRGLGSSTAEVRAERVGTGNGRVYHIFFTATDDQGGSCSGEVLIGVPVSQNGSPAVDDGPLYDSTTVP